MEQNPTPDVYDPRVAYVETLVHTNAALAQRNRLLTTMGTWVTVVAAVSLLGNVAQAAGVL